MYIGTYKKYIVDKITVNYNLLSIVLLSKIKNKQALCFQRLNLLSLRPCYIIM